MTVRIAKQPINLRERLSELERPIGLKGSELMGADTAQEAGSLLGVGRRNLCINGNFKIWQRGTSIAGGASGNSSAGYKYVTADRFQTYYPNTYARQDSVLPNGEKVYSLRETFSSTRLFFTYTIEDGGRLFNQGDYITISFWAKTSGKSTGVSLGFYWYTGPNWSAYTYSSVRKNVIIEGSEWKYYTATTQIPANTNDRPHLAIEFDNSSSYGPWSLLSTNEWWEFANIQIEKGKVATEFEHRSYGDELARCERYFQIIADAADNTSQECIEMAVTSSSNGLFGCTTLRTTMRTTPTIYNTATNFRINSPGGGDQNSTTAPTISTHSGRRNIRIEQSGYTGLTANFAGILRLNGGTGIVAMQAEL